MVTASNKNLSSHSWEESIARSDDYVKDMLSFFDEGWDARGADDKKKLQNRIKANIFTTFTYIEEIVELIRENSFTPKSVFAKMDNPTSAIVLLAVTLEDYVNPGFLQIYDYASEIESKSKSENYSISFSMTFDDGSFNEECIKSDGFADISNLLEGE
jgi:hypothetical protein